jgi:prolyl oligopeptidase
MNLSQPARALACLGLLALAACATGLRLPPQSYPPTQKVAVVEDFHGTPVADPYRWMEALDSSQVANWVVRQNRLSAGYLAQLPQRAPIQRRLTELYRYERFGVPRRAGNLYFYLRNDGEQNQAALQVSGSAQDLGRRLIDPDSISGDSTVALAEYEPSPDGRLLAYSLSDAGSDWKSWHVRDSATGVDRPDLITQTKFTRVSWATDGSGFYYSSYPQGDDQRQPAIHFHRLGDAQAADSLVYAVTDHPTRTPEGRVTLDGRYLVIVLEEGTVSNGVSVMALGGDHRVQAVFDDYTGLYGYLGSRQGVGTELLFTTTRGAARGRVIAVDLGKPVGQQERVVVPEGPQVLEQAALVGNRVIASYLKDAHALVRRFDAASGESVGDLPLPGLGAVGGFTGDADSTETYFSYTDFFTPTRIYRMDLRDGSVTLLRAPTVAADLSGYVTEQVFFTSRDGTRVPMFIIHRRDLKRDGRNPLMLYGYGGFDVSLTPGFSAATLAWLEMGGVYAVPNLRGGGEYGEAWHLAGTRANKQNVFDDFIAAAEYLVREHYTQPQRLVIRGGSNGGLLVGAVLTQRPELFGAALPDVGVLDMLRYHLASANARQWSDDYGLSDNETDFRAQYAYSPYHNADRHHCYPPTLVTTAAQDNRVVPWHSFKFTAALQGAQRCAKPILVRVETRAGHGAGKPVWMQVEQLADQWAFAAAAVGIRLSGTEFAQRALSSP